MSIDRAHPVHPGRHHRLRVRLLAGLATLLTLTAPLAVAGPAAAEPPVSLPEVLQRLGVDAVPADYVLMVDVSASMQQGGRYESVKQALRAFLAALAPDDRVELGIFADTATVVYDGPAGRSPDALLAKLPATATGNHTDIGAAIESIVTTLRRPQAPAIATVVLLTDGQHEPPAGSPYPYAQGYAWNQLAQQTAALTKTSLQAFAVPLTGVTGAGLLLKVFPRATVVDPTSIDQLAGRLEVPKAAARAAKARTLLGDDPARGVRVEWPASVHDLGDGSGELTLTLTAATAHIPLAVTGIAVTADDPSVRVMVRDTQVELPAGQSRPVRLQVDWDAGGLHAAPLSTVSRRTVLHLTGTVASPWSDVLTRDLGVAFKPDLTGVDGPADLSAQRGSYLLWLLGLLLLAALVYGLLRVRGRRLQPALSGTLRAVLDGAEHRMALHGDTAVLNHGTIGLPGYGEVRLTRPSIRSAEVRLSVTYSRNGSVTNRAAGICPPGGTCLVDGVEFFWQSAVPAQAGHDRTVPQDAR